MSTLIDLTKVSVNFQLEFDTLDAILIVTTGGLGYLARRAYNHFNGKSARDIELQRQNLVSIIDEAAKRGANRLIVRIHPAVAIYSPAGGSFSYIARTSEYDKVEIMFS